MERPLDVDAIAWFGRIPARITIGGAMPGQVRVAGEVRRLTLVPRNGEGELIAELRDGTGVLNVYLPWRHASAWAPGSLLAVEGDLRPGRPGEPRRLDAAMFAAVEIGVSECLVWVRARPAADGRAPRRATEGAVQVEPGAFHATAAGRSRISSDRS